MLYKAISCPNTDTGDLYVTKNDLSLITMHIYLSLGALGF